MMKEKKTAFACSALIAALGLTVGQAQALNVNGQTVDRVSGPLQVDGSSAPAGGGSILSPFSIALDWNGGAAGLGTGPGGSNEAAFNSARATWESLITGYQEDFGFAGGQVIIQANLDPIDGPGGILGSAGPTNVWVQPSFIVTTQGSMTFDSADIPGLGSLFEDVVLHEMGHVLGIGTLWSSSGVGVPGYQEVYVGGSGQYTGAFGLAAFNSEFSQAGASVPVELGGGGGTANGHWNEVDGDVGNTGLVSNIEPGPFNDFRHELMTGWLNPNGTFISSLTVESMRDIGYNVVPEPSSLALLGLGGLAIARRRRRG